jgi:AraC-like DNA-binding protein
MSRGPISIAATAGIRGPLAGPGAGRIVRVLLPADGSPVLWRVRDAPSQLCLIVPEEGTVLVRTGERRELAALPGAALVLAGHERFAVATPGGGRMLVVTSPRAPIEALVGSACETGPLGPSALLAAGARFLGDLSSEGGCGADDGRGAGAGVGGSTRTAALDRMLRELIVAVLLEERASEPADALWLGLFDRAIEHIAGHRTDRDLNSESLARALSISVRQLQRAFAAGGTTPKREIRRHRAALATSMLGDRAFAALSIEQISHQCGFRNAADMRRALSCHELPSPSLIRSLGAHPSPERRVTTP